jgi:hypothetical protein
MMCVGQEAERSARIRAAELIRKLDKTFEALAQTAEAVARAEEDNAAIHDSAADFLPGAVEHAARARRFAKAE